MGGGQAAFKYRLPVQGYQATLRLRGGAKAMTRFPKTPQPLTIQNRFNFDREDYLEQCRETAKRLLRHGGTVTIEDVSKLCPRPTYLHPNIMGSVFNKEFKQVGFKTAKNPAARGHVIREWVLR